MCVCSELSARNEIVLTEGLDKWNYDLGNNFRICTFMLQFTLINDATVSYKLYSFHKKRLHQAHTTNTFAYKMECRLQINVPFVSKVQSPWYICYVIVWSANCSGTELNNGLQKNLSMDVTLDRVTILLGTHSQ